MSTTPPPLIARIDVPDTPPEPAAVRMALRDLIARPDTPVAPDSVRELAWGVGLAVVRHRRRPPVALPQDAA